MTIVLAALVALGAVAFLTVTLVDRARDAKQPPPLASHAPGVQRITVQRWFSIRNPPFGAERADGTKVGLSAAKPAPDTPSDALPLYVAQATPQQLVDRNVRTGDTFTALGLRVTVLKVWRMPNPEHDAIDVRAVPA
ncbi:hypothetical protein [Streptomyces sp. NRRL F-5123]|uniref:hypothetical protein n=1 Tax=Streptomyces sp. NRRL F-5123 TaxID=1463856 RepID=UPI0004E18BB5|nr:hypothetical protein [Streptomyces sp. NRRL F-5123]